MGFDKTEKRMLCGLGAITLILGAFLICLAGWAFEPRIVGLSGFLLQQVCPIICGIAGAIWLAIAHDCYKCIK